MTKMFNSFVLLAFLMVPAVGQSAGTTYFQGFKEPTSRCLTPSGNLIITSTGTISGSLPDMAKLDVVAAVQPGQDQLTPTDHASINVYDSFCHLFYRQVFPGAGEVTFETIHWNGQTLLHLVTMSAVEEPADDVIYNHIILIENYDGSFLPVQPPFLTSDKTLSIFIGNIGDGRGFGIVETFQLSLGQKPPLISPLSVMFQLKSIKLPEGQELNAFVGPTVIRAPTDKDSRDAWPDTSYATGFPLMHFFYGKWGGG